MRAKNEHWSYERDLIERLKTGEQSAWSEFTKEYSARVYNYLLAYLPDLESVDDVLSETLLASVKGIKSVPEYVSLTTWLLSLAQRKIADFWRKQNQHPVSESLADLSQFPAETLTGSQIEMKEMLEKLPETERQVLLMRYQTGLSVNEIAAIMQLTESAIHVSLRRARNHLRELSMHDELPPMQFQSRFELIVTSVSQMLQVHIVRCLANGMTHEAEIFAHHAKLLAEAMVESRARETITKNDSAANSQFYYGH